MGDHTEFRRNATKRRYTEIHHVTRGDTDHIDKSSQTDLTVSANLFEELSKIIDPETSSLDSIYSVAIKLLKTCTSSSWVEFALIEDNKLQICSFAQQHQFLDIESNSSLMAYVATHEEPVLLTNPHTSSFYTKFPIQLQAFSLLTSAPVKPSSIACIPLYDNCSKLYGIVQLFNKLDRNCSQSFFSQEDIFIVSSIGKFLGTILNTRRTFSRLEHRHDQALKIIDYNKSLFNVSNNFKRKNKLLDGLSNLAEQGQSLSKEIIEIVADIMESSSAFLIKNVDKEPEVVVGVGKMIDWEKIIGEIQIAMYSKRVLTNLRDVFHFGMNAKVKSCVIICTKQENNELYLLLFRDSKEFEVVDEDYGYRISDILKGFDWNIGAENNSRIKAENLLSFEIPDIESYNLIPIFQEFKEKFSLISDINSCSVYIVNQRAQTLWTKNTHSSESLIYPISKESILGYTYLNKTTVILPDSTKSFTDIKHYKEKYIICLPVIEKKLKYPVIAIVLISKSSSFTDLDLWAMHKFIDTFGSVLYVQYLEIVEKFTYKHSTSMMIQPSLASKNLFKQMNKSPTSSSRVIPMEDKKLAKLSLIEGTLEVILKCDEVKILLNEAQTDTEEINSYIKVAKKNDKYIYIPNMKSDENSSLLIYPIDSSTIVYFRNFSTKLSRLEIEPILTLAQLLFELKPPQPMQEKIIEQIKLESILSKWISQLIYVSNMTMHKLFICKSVIYKLASKNDMINLTYMSLDILSTITNSSDVCIIIREDIGYVKFHGKSVVEELDDEEVEMFEECIENYEIKKYLSNNTHGNMIVVPIIYSECIGIMILSGKKDETNREFTVFTNKDEIFLREFSKRIAQPLSEYKSPFDITLQSFSLYLRHLAIRYSPQTLLISIRKASQVIFNCDKVNLFLLNQNNLVLLTHGFGDQISEGFTVKIEDSIFENSVKYGQAEFINDVYGNSSYDPEIDIITAYKTNTVLMIPLRDSSGKFFCLIQCINKRTGKFDEKDIESAQKISEVFERVLENWELVKKNIDEIFRLKGITNSIASFILVFNQEGRLSYTNQPIEGVFGVSESQVHKLHFSEWMNINKDLKEDIENVYNNPTLKIRRTSQKIKSGQFRKMGSLTSLMLEDAKKPNIFNYRVVQLQDISNELFSGVVVILEDNSALEALHQEFKEVQDQLRAITSPISAETGLQKCIRELNFISDQVKNSDVKEQIFDVIERLKAGGLKKPKFLLNDVDKQEFETVNSIFYQASLDNLEEQPVIVPRLSFVNDNAEIIPLSILRDWNLNAFTVNNKYDYIYSMLSDFNAIEQYNIKGSTLFNFISKVQKECDKRKNPFHNFTHCFSVMHSTYMLLSSTSAGSFFSGLNILGLLIAAVCHDVDHTGRTNMFEVSSKSKLAITYNDKSVLEQHHAAVTFEIMTQEDANIFQHLARETFRDLRKIMITAIIGTDMSKHYSILTNINARAKDMVNSPIGTVAKDTERVAQFILHAADLAHPTKMYRTYEMWSMLVCQEFSDQNLEETAKGLPITEFMKDLQNPKVYYANEIGFLNYVVRPLWDCANNLLKPHIYLLVENLERNIEEMKKKLEEWKKVEG
ncbi:hypothetical protein SteCoe_30158 [Stentor coeruleus]|uniref:Phosphodiesterase n=1 Tax=Stentor coeruleus TaxID=5963 RepID=A0A1R2B473_9CILI|nr:hypothetical protein SteCoe_30158 [Stentor coeruleus]